MIKDCKPNGTALATYIVGKGQKSAEVMEVALLNRENVVSNTYQELESDNYSHPELATELLNNIDRLKDLEKRLAFMLREIDLAVNKS